MNVKLRNALLEFGGYEALEDRDARIATVMVDALCLDVTSVLPEEYDPTAFADPKKPVGTVTVNWATGEMRIHGFQPETGATIVCFNA